MSKLLVSGVYDPQTLKNLFELGAKSIAFDLRGRSTNLIPFSQLKAILSKHQMFTSALIFENDRATTIHSFLNMLKETESSLELQFRDKLTAEFYDQFRLSFQWMFHPESDWQNVLKSTHLKSILLPVKYQDFYQAVPHFWDSIHERQIEVYLHAEGLEELSLISDSQGVNISFDLSQELENGFRSIDQEKLRKLKVWRLKYEDLAS